MVEQSDELVYVFTGFLRKAYVDPETFINMCKSIKSIESGKCQHKILSIKTLFESKLIWEEKW